MALSSRNASSATNVTHPSPKAVGHEPAHEEHIIRTSLDGEAPETEAKNMKVIVTIVYIALIGLGIGTGYLLAGRPSLAAGQAAIGGGGGGGAGTGDPKKVAGVEDTSEFKDQATGTLQKGGLDGEGSHQLVREGGPSQTVYLVSSVIDLDAYVGKTVKIWGQTQAAKKAPWLMDVGRLEVQ